MQSSIVPFEECKSAIRRSLIGYATFRQEDKSVKQRKHFRRRLVDGANNRLSPTG